MADQGCIAATFVGPSQSCGQPAVCSLQVILRSVNPHRPMDLTAGLVSADMGAAALSPVELGDGTEWGPLLRAGSAIAEEARSAVKVGLH